MVRLFSKALLALALAATLPVVVPVASAAAKKDTSDDALYNNVRRKLANDIHVKGGALDVAVDKGVVTIKGVIESDALKSRAEKLAAKVPGVKKVVNEIRVSPGGVT